MRSTRLRACRIAAVRAPASLVKAAPFSSISAKPSRPKLKITTATSTSINETPRTARTGAERNIEISPTLKPLFDGRRIAPPQRKSQAPGDEWTGGADERLRLAAKAAIRRTDAAM